MAKLIRDRAASLEQGMMQGARRCAYIVRAPLAVSDVDWEPE